MMTSSASATITKPDVVMIPKDQPLPQGSDDDDDYNFHSEEDPRVVTYCIMTASFHVWTLMASFDKDDPTCGLFMFFVRISALCLLSTKATSSSFIPMRMHHDGIHQLLGIIIVLLVGIYDLVSRAPFLWDSEFWRTQADLVLLVWVVLGTTVKTSECRYCCSPTITTAPTSMILPGSRHHIDYTWNHCSTQMLSQTMMDIFACFYFAAGFWKLNTHFWDPNASCATIFFLQMFANYVVVPLQWGFKVLNLEVPPGSLFLLEDDSEGKYRIISTSIIFMAKSIKSMAPILTILVEMMQGTLLVLGTTNVLSIAKQCFRKIWARSMSVITIRADDNRSLHKEDGNDDDDGGRRYQRCGVMMVLLFHFGVCCTPQPNDISGFALQCSAPLIWFATPQGVNRVITWIRPHSIPLVPTIVLLMAVGYSQQWTPNNYAFLLYSALGGFVFLAVYTENDKCTTAETTYKATSSTSKSVGHSGKRKSVKMKFSRPLWSWAALALAVAYSFGGLLLGLQEEGTPNMFANLKVHGGSNHFFLPTGLLFHYFGNAHTQDYNTDSHIFGGGVVRVEHTTSYWMSYVYPADLTSLLQPSPVITELLEQIGFPTPAFFNPGASRILGITPPLEPGKKFIPYTVPALELKRLLREAKSHDGSFELVYAQLPGTRGDEVWRATAVRRRFHVQVLDGQVTDCQVTDYNVEQNSLQSSETYRKGHCGPLDLPLLSDSSVPYWVQKLSMYHAYPIVPDTMGQVRPSIVCFGP